MVYLDRRLFGAAGWRLSAFAVDLVILQPAWRGFEAVECLERPDLYSIRGGQGGRSGKLLKRTRKLIGCFYNNLIT